MNDVMFFHGAVIVRVLRSKQFKAVGIYEGNNSSYLVNDSIGIYLKYSQKKLSPWTFTFQHEHIAEIISIFEKWINIYLVLICNDDGICCLDWKEFSTVISVENDLFPKWIKASRLKNEKYHVSGRDGELRHKIGNSDFPEKIFSIIDYK